MYIHQSSKYSYRMEEDLHTGAKKKHQKNCYDDLGKTLSIKIDHLL